jgi:hypothetical protein
VTTRIAAEESAVARASCIFFHDASLPLFALTMFAKNERVDLSAAERNEFRSLTKILVETYGKART